MEQHKIDFLKNKYQLSSGRRWSFVFFGKFFATALVVTAIIGGCLSYRVPSSGDISSTDIQHFSLFSTLRGLFSAGDTKLKGEENDRVNLLFLGVGGGTHDGAQLTDTIIFTSLRPSDKAVGMISIPRDLTVPVSENNWRKINAVNALAEAENSGSGPEKLIDVLSPLINQDINYYVKVDFSGFSELVDIIGGIKVYVENSFSDYQYPIEGMENAICSTTESTNDLEEITEAPDYTCRFKTVTFTEGWTQMDGQTALEYVRSRHGTNGEASDFARSRRQQNLMVAIKEKILSLDTLSHPSRISAILSSLDKHIQTNLGFGELIRLGREFGSIDSSKITNQVLDNSSGGPLYETNINGAYVLLPKNDDWTPIQYLAENIFTTTSNSLATATPNIATTVKVEIQNGTTISGLAYQVSQIISAQGFEVIKIGNTVERGYQQTIVYDLTNGQKKDELTKIQNVLLTQVATSKTGWIYSDDIVPKEISVEGGGLPENTIDFLIILGEDNSNLVKK